jgi:hypothetical protein
MLTEEQRKGYKRCLVYGRVVLEWSKITQLEARWRGQEQHRATVQRSLDFVRSQKVGKVCATCGEPNSAKLCFHHVDPATKLFNVGSYSGRSETSLLEEIAKCILLCRACHQRHHKTK